MRQSENSFKFILLTVEISENYRPNLIFVDYKNTIQPVEPNDCSVKLGLNSFDNKQQTLI